MLRLYHSPGTRSIRPRWLLEELGVAYDLVTMEFRGPEMTSADYMRLNPFGKVPAIEDNGLVIFESGAIVQYILERYGEGRLEPPPGDPTRGLYLQWFHFAESTGMWPVRDYLYQTRRLPAELRLPGLADHAAEGARRMLKVVDDSLAGKPYLTGDMFTAADIMIGYTLLLARAVGLPVSDYDNVAAYLDRMTDRPAYRVANPD